MTSQVANYRTTKAAGRATDRLFDRGGKSTVESLDTGGKRCSGDVKSIDLTPLLEQASKLQVLKSAQVNFISFHFETI